MHNSEILERITGLLKSRDALLVSWKTCIASPDFRVLRPQISAHPRYVLFPALRQCLLKLFDPSVGDLGVHQVQRLEFGQPFEVFQPSVGDLGATSLSDWSWSAL